MKRPTSLMLLCAALCCLAFARPAVAQYGANIYVDAFVTFDHENGWVHGGAYASADYAYGCYYEIDLTADLESGDGSQFTWGYYIGDNYASVHLFLDLYADTEYTVQADYDVNVYYSYEYYGYYDPNNFYYWANQYVNALGPFNFFGPGPETFSPSSFQLGRNYNQRRSREPHHLRVESDIIRDVDSSDPIEECGQKIRLIRYRVVNFEGEPVGKTAVGELFPGTIRNNCTLNEVPSTPCSRIVGGQLRPNYTDGGGRFTDNLAIGCPAPHDDCGFTNNPNLWNWCTFSGFTAIRTPLAKLNYETRKRVITINERATPWPNRTQFFSDGSTLLPPGL